MKYELGVWWTSVELNCHCAAASDQKIVIKYACILSISYNISFSVNVWPFCVYVETNILLGKIGDVTGINSAYTYTLIAYRQEDFWQYADPT